MVLRLCRLQGGPDAGVTRLHRLPAGHLGCLCGADRSSCKLPHLPVLAMDPVTSVACSTKPAPWPAHRAARPQVQQFWADPRDLALGAVFKQRGPAQPLSALKRPLAPAAFDAGVEQGFQAGATWHQGAIVRQEAGAGGVLPSTVDSCRWAFSVRPVVGWGDVGTRQKATAGWLAALPVFEPHWQVVMAHGLATGWIEWGGRRYEFTDAPHYVVRGGCLGEVIMLDRHRQALQGVGVQSRAVPACLPSWLLPGRLLPLTPAFLCQEKNWGGGFPRRWCWVQCNTFEGEPGTSVTAVGALRGLLGVPGVEENVGMIGIHHRGR